MKILFDKIEIMSQDDTLETVYLATDGCRIAYIGKDKPDGTFDRVISGAGRLLIPGMYNLHCHSAMNLLRGIGEDIPLDDWLNKRIFPAEDKLTAESVYLSSLMSAAEMIAGGVTSFSDMYFFCEATAKAVTDSGMKANIARGIVAFDENDDPRNDRRLSEAVSLYENFNGASDGRILVDFSMQGEYLITERMCRAVADTAAKYGSRIQIHLSETKKEHDEGIARRGMTPAQFFDMCGVFDVPSSAAHCVHVSENDMALLARTGVTAVHNPVSNLKLGSGIMPLRQMLDGGVNVALGTDGAASNNTIDVLRELSFASLIHKGVSGKADIITSRELMPMLSENAATAQGRIDCGRLEVGMRADICVLDITKPHTVPVRSVSGALCYSLHSQDVVMTVSDGRILYEMGEYTTIDIEKLQHDFDRMSLLFE